MSDYSQYASLMWPVMGTRLDGAHVTLMFLGEIENLEVTPEEIVKTFADQNLRDVGYIYSTGLEVFGDEDKVIVATLDTTILKPTRDAMVYFAKDKLGLEDASRFPEYRPHVTLGTNQVDMYNVRFSYYLAAPQLWWGGEHYAF